MVSINSSSGGSGMAIPSFPTARLKYPRAASNLWCGACCCPTSSGAISGKDRRDMGPQDQTLCGGSIRLSEETWWTNWTWMKHNQTELPKMLSINTHHVYHKIWCVIISNTCATKRCGKNRNKVKHPHRTAEPLTPSNWPDIKKISNKYW